MNILEIINKKRLKQELSYEELKYAFMGYLDEQVENYQMSSLLMAIVLNGMNDRETMDLTDIFLNSGDILDLSSIKGVKVDKHSTGGIGDKTTLIVGPIVASLGVKMCKMSGRGLGHTGGTIDKLESIPGFNVNLTNDEILNEVNDIGISLSAQTNNLTPLDKKVYALRDVTGTVESIPLIAASIMSKKIASGADKIIIDIKLGDGALIKTKEDAERLSVLVKTIGNKYNREVRTLITNMSTPLGNNIGNALEVKEAMDVLQGKQKDTYLYKVCVELAANLVSMALQVEMDEAVKLVENSITNGSAYQKFLELIKYQNGDINSLKISENIVEVKSEKEGTLKNIDALIIGKISCNLGSNRMTIDDVIDPSVGVVLNKKIGDHISIGDTLCYLYMGSRINELDPLTAFEIE